MQSLFEERNSENYSDCMERISGCLLDLIFIVNSRLIILTVGKRWLHECVYEIYYVNCQFELSREFKYSYFGVYSIVGINTIVTALIIVYMIKKQKQLFDYRINNNHLFNIYYLFMFHSMFEGSLQIGYYIVKK